MRTIYNKYSKIIISAVILIISISIAMGALFGYAEIIGQKFKDYFETITPKYGQLEFSDADNLGEFDITKFNSIKATEEAKIMVFTDLHFGYVDDLTSKLGYYEKQDKKVFDNIQKAVKKENPSLLIFLGDNIEGQDSEKDIKTLADNIDSLGVPWTLVFGNHDGDAAFYGGNEDLWLLADKAYMANFISKYPNSLFREGFAALFDDGMYSVGNDLINVYINEKLVYNLVLMDSNSYIPPDYEYDYIREEQVKWYDWATRQLDTPNMVFMHIPIAQYKSAMSAIGIKVPEAQRIDTGLFEKMKANRATDIFAGHLHAFDYDTAYENINFHFAVTSSQKRLSAFTRPGYKLVTIDANSVVKTEKKIFNDCIYEPI